MKAKWVPWGPLVLLWAVATLALYLAFQAVYEHYALRALIEGVIAGATYSWAIGSAWAWQQLINERHDDVQKVLDLWKASIERLERRS